MKSKRWSCTSHTFINSNVTYVQGLQQEMAGRRGHVFHSRQCKQPYIDVKKKSWPTRLEVPFDVVTLNSETGINVNQAKLSPPIALCFSLISSQATPPMGMSTSRMQTENGPDCLLILSINLTLQLGRSITGKNWEQRPKSETTWWAQLVRFPCPWRSLTISSICPPN